MKLNFFTKDETFPFFIQYGYHEGNLFLHSHENFHELVIVLNGEAIHIVNDEEFYISKGDVFIIGADTVHGYQNTRNFQICNIMFHYDFFFDRKCDIKELAGFQGLFVIEPILAQKRSFMNRLKLNIFHFELIRKKINQMITEYKTKQVGYKTLVTGEFYSLSVLLSRIYSSSRFDQENDVIGMAKSIAYIESHYTSEIPIEMLAKIAGFSTRHYTRRFFEIKQTTPTHYIQAMRLEKACYYLNNSDLSMSAIAQLCGFSDSNYFSRLFRKHYGISPTVYRRNRT